MGSGAFSRSVRRLATLALVVAAAFLLACPRFPRPPRPPRPPKPPLPFHEQTTRAPAPLSVPASAGLSGFTARSLPEPPASP